MALCTGDESSKQMDTGEGERERWSSFPTTPPPLDCSHRREVLRTMLGNGWWSLVFCLWHLITSRGIMGNLLKVLACTELEHGPIVFLDFEHAQPTEAETVVWNQVSAVLEEAHGILAELQSYNGAGQEIREAIQNPNDLQLQEKAWNAVCPLVAKLKRFYEFSLRLGEWVANIFAIAFFGRKCKWDHVCGAQVNMATVYGESRQALLPALPRRDVAMVTAASKAQKRQHSRPLCVCTEDPADQGGDEPQPVTAPAEASLKEP
ncbi:hypothetical protein P4O66_019372 [Electrophorus voltai]|uniref:CYRIA/CYRIB Rac1 binding domain-containing protein n=1 Tax=Electrophorus voltai TaxID=2609070 RepID=A0AAD8ZVF8_9TELE|nr:hypothetical protein P4O66_019372 [Electrophorus voltai]